MRKETKERDGTTYHLRYYNDWLDFVSCAERVERGRKDLIYGGMSCESVRQEREQWYGTDTLAKAISFARRGWSEGRLKVRDMRKMLNIKNLMPYSQRIKVTKDVSGDEPDIGLFLQGEPENMTTLWESQIAQRGRVVRFVLNRTANHYIESNRIVLRGIALIIAFEALIQLGYSADLTICFSETPTGYGGNARIEYYIPVLHAGDPINMDTLAFMFIQPAVLRRLQFAANECEPVEIRKQFGYSYLEGYGGSCDPVFLPEHDLFLKWEDGLLRDQKEVGQFVFDILDRVGINFAKHA